MIACPVCSHSFALAKLHCGDVCFHCAERIEAPAVYEATVVIRDRETGETGVESTIVPHDDPYWWEQGNMSCDCNRHLVVYPGSDAEVDCGGERYEMVTLSFTDHGKQTRETLRALYRARSD